MKRFAIIAGVFSLPFVAIIGSTVVGRIISGKDDMAIGGLIITGILGLAGLFAYASNKLFPSRKGKAYAKFEAESRSDSGVYSVSE